jgi:hypothetical protein
MANEAGPIGFFALWHNKRSEYHAGRTEERETGEQIQQAFDAARKRGIKIFGLYGSRWSSERQYFTFWLCPTLTALELTLDNLERAGDFKFADSEHVIGVRLDDPEMTDKAYLDRLEGGDSDLPLGFFALWRQTDGYYRADPGDWQTSNRAVRAVFKEAQNQGVRMFGRYDCRWSSRWDYFTFWLVPSLETLEMTMERLEPAGDFKFADSRHIIGNLEPHFRFGRHLQAVSDWSQGE